MAVTQILRADASGAVKGVQDLNKEIDKSAQEFSDAAKKANELQGAARRVAEQADPQRRYNRQINELAGLVQKGKVELNDAEIVAAKYGRRLENAGRSGRAAFGAQFAGNIRNTILGFFGVQQALQAIVQGFRDVRAEQEKAQQAALQSRAGIGELSQLAATEANPEQAFQNLVREARRARASGAADSQQEAANLLFGLVSAGLGQSDRDFAFQLRSQGTLQNIGGAGTAFSALTSAVGAEEVGSFEDFISKSLRASSIAPALANQIPQAATRAGGSARALGLTDEFLLAATAILGRTTGTAEQGGTQLASFLKQIEKAIPDNAEFAGRSGIELIETLAGLSEEEQGFGGVLGDRAEAIQGFRTLKSNLGLLKQLVSDVDAADDNGLARRALGLPATDSQASAALARAASEGRAEVALGDEAALQNLLDAALAERRTSQLADSDTALTRALIGIQNALVESDRFFGTTTREGIEGALRSFVEDGSIRDRELLERIAQSLDDQTLLLQRRAQPDPVTVGREE